MHSRIMRWQNETSKIQTRNATQGQLVKFISGIKLMPWDNGHSYICHTFFDQPVKGSLGARVADNLPVNNGAYQEVCSTPSLSVYYEYQTHHVVDALLCIHGVRGEAGTNTSCRFFVFLLLRH